MDFTNRSAQVPENHNAPLPMPAAAPAVQSKKRHQGGGPDNKWFRFGVAGFFALVVILIVGVILVISSSSNNSVDNESKYVNTSKLQAVFLNTGQVYFGNVKAFNSHYVVLTNIFYLQTSSNGSSSTPSSTSSSSNNNVSLVKLGCELHRPYDQMVINRSQVTFWENLQSDGQVAKAVAQFNQQNPNGQKCSDQSSSAPTNSSSNTQNAPTSGNGTATHP